MNRSRIRSLVATGAVVVTCGVGAAVLAPAAVATPQHPTPLDAVPAAEAAAAPAFDAFGAGAAALATLRGQELTELTAAIAAD
ncbi:MAG: hypothetical protein HOQ13_15970, partial [Dermatophilaceae bacterium]|nr:hypothetical protein [Dermatophilaceae bacterium]